MKTNNNFLKLDEYNENNSENQSKYQKYLSEIS